MTLPAEPAFSAEPVLPSEPVLPAEPVLPVDPPSPDTAFGSFSAHDPLGLDLDAIPCQCSVDRVRRGKRHEVPRNLASGRLPPIGRLTRTLVEIESVLGGWVLFVGRRLSSRACISRRLRMAFQRLG